MTSTLQLRRILMTTDAVGGVWQYAVELCRALKPHDIEIILATMGPRPGREQRTEIAALANVTLCESDHRLEWMAHPWEDVKAAGQWLLELEWRYAPDLVHLNGFAHGALPWRAPCLVVAHSCVLSWWQAVHGVAAPEEWDCYRAAVVAGLMAADLVVAPTQAMRAAIIRHYGEPSACRVIRNGREPGVFGRAEEKENFVLSVGRLWDEAKNVGALAGAASAVTWPIRMVGETRSPDGAVRSLAHVETLGRRTPSELAELYARAAIYALPARYEPFGLSILEAALAGCALVLGDIASLRELWDDAAEFAVPDDQDALAAALARLTNDTTLRHRRAAQARLRAAQYSTRRMVGAYLEAYQQLLARGAKLSRITAGAV